MQEVVSPTGETDNGCEPGNKPISSILNDEDQARAATYAILAALLSDIPTPDTVDYLRHISSPVDGEHVGEVGEAWQELKMAADQADLEALDDEYHDLFIGVGRGEIIPYGSWHITGFLMDKPLSDLRDDLRALGFESDPDSKEPEDHIAAICETMSILIGADDVEGYQQRRFYLKHLYPWAQKFFEQLQQAKKADFYRAVGLLGQRFIQLENQYLNVQEH